MKHERDGQVGDVLEGLIQKVERLNKEKMEEYERSRKALSSLDKLSEAIYRLESNKRREKLMARKIAQVYSCLDKDAEAEGRIQTKSISETVTGVLNVAKASNRCN
jgi:hypothetical protein